jgi:hypothetical protein
LLKRALVARAEWPVWGIFRFGSPAILKPINC